MSLIDRIQIVGHVCHDITSDGIILGGTASYASFMASHICSHVSLLTSFGNDFQFQDQFTNAGVELECLVAPETTMFENIYKGESRVQYLHSKADDIRLEKNFLKHSSNLLLLCPIANEVFVSESVLSTTKALKAATIQGWLRKIELNGKVVPFMPDQSVFEGLDVVIMSDDDILGIPDFVQYILDMVALIIVTHGADGATGYQNRSSFHFPSYQTDPIDLTGAGDVFSTVFLCAYANKRDIVFASSMAHSAASLSIEGVGLNSIPTLPEILKRQKIYIKDYL